MKTKALPMRTIIIPLAMIYAAMLFLSAAGRLRESETSTVELNTEISELEAENARLEYYIAHRNDDSVIASVIGEQLGLTDKDSILFYDAGGSQP